MIQLKHKNLLRIVFRVFAANLLALCIWFYSGAGRWESLDSQALDLFYRFAVEKGHGPKPAFSPQVVYLTITDAGYDAFGTNHLDRSDLAELNMALAELGPEAVAYDIIFPRKSSPDADQAFARSLEALGSAWLPLALELSDRPEPPGAKGLSLPEQAPLLRGMKETALPSPYSALRALTQLPLFSRAAAGSGNISLLADRDGIFRRLPLLVGTEKGYIPSLAFALFLDWADIRPQSIHIHWGKEITLHPGPDNFLEQKVSIPIDEKGRVFIPFVNRSGKDFRQMEAHSLIRLFKDPGLRGNLMDFFEGSFVLVADTAVGTSDLGDTPLEANAPLVSLHASLLNSLLTRTFYRPWPMHRVMALLVITLVILTGAAMLRSPWFLYCTGLAVPLAILYLTGAQFRLFHLFPVATVLLAVFIIFSSLVISLEAATAKDRAFIKTTFARYLPETVVARLLDNPKLLTLGGEERVATVLFSDIAGFTTLSEQLSPKALVELLNQYFTAMTRVIQDQGGIIDKYIGDAIMAEFGVPLETENHPDQAVHAALAMQRELSLLQTRWAAMDLPKIACRIGINTNKMVVGNIGSDRVFDYTVLGDAVNLASRLESAGKKYGVSLIISRDTFERLTPGMFRTRLLDYVIVKGKSRAVKIYEVLSAADQPLDDEKYYHCYERAFHTYLEQDFAAALDGFRKALELRPDDRASKKMITRIQALIDERKPLPRDWDGAVRLTEK